MRGRIVFWYSRLVQVLLDVYRYPFVIMEVNLIITPFLYSLVVNEGMLKSHLFGLNVDLNYEGSYYSDTS